MPAASRTDANQGHAAALPSLDNAAGLRDLLGRAARGDQAVLPLVRELFDRDREGGRGLLAHYGDAYAHARRAITEPAARGDLAAREALGRTIDALRDELAGPAATPLERILAERVALCWFDAHDTDRRFHDQSGQTFEGAGYQEGRRDRAHRRFLAACRMLAVVRKLGAPALQINVARQQVNVAGSVS